MTSALLEEHIVNSIRTLKEAVDISPETPGRDTNIDWIKSI